MARKKARRTRTTRAKIQEMDAQAPGGAEDVIEFDPNVQAAATEVAVQAAAESVSELQVDEGMLAARDEIIARLGGKEAMAEARSFAAAAEEPMGLENIQGVGIGVKETSGGFTGDMAVKVLVKEKMPASQLSTEARIPESVGGMPTDVEAAGEFVASSYARRFRRPVPCGVSCGHVDITAGTIGCLVVLNNNRLAILSNNHVLANENNAGIGDHIIQPGDHDGGQDPADLIGLLERFVRIDFPGPNLVDAAAAWTAFRLVKPQHVTYNMNPQPVQASLFSLVMKNGRTTQATVGFVSAVNVDGVPVRYDAGVAEFDDQIIIRSLSARPFSQGGDSGSVIVTLGSKQPLGLLFAGSSSHTIANPIGAVISELGINRFIGGA